MQRIFIILLLATIAVVTLDFSGLQTIYAKTPPNTKKEIVDTYNQGLVVYNSGDYAKASDLFAQVCREAPSFMDAYCMYGTCLANLKKPQAALEQLLKAQAIDANDGPTLVNLAGVYMSLGNLKLAHETFQKFLQLYPNDPSSPRVRDALETIANEESRVKGQVSSKGLDNYLEESVHNGAVRWPASQFPISIYIAPGSGIKDFKEEYTVILRQAFASWAECSGGKVSFKYTDDPNKAGITCRWLDDPTKLVNPGEGGEAIPSSTSEGDIVKVEISILIRPRSDADTLIRHICLHEIGHALGLEHSSQPGDLMFITESERLGALSDRDKKTLRMLYEAPASFIAAHPPVYETQALQGNTNPRNQAIRLNSEGSKAYNAGNYVKAMGLFQQSMKLAPDLDVPYLNMGNVYYEFGRGELDKQNLVAAEKYYNLSVENYVKGNRKDLAVHPCTVLISIAKFNNKAADVQKYETLKTRLTGP